MKPQLWIKTSSGTVTIEDLGLVLSTEPRNLVEEFGYARIADSLDLVAIIGTAGVEFSEIETPWDALDDSVVEDILSSFTKLDHETTIGNVHQVNANDIGADNIVTELNTNASGTINLSVLDPEVATSTGVSLAISEHASSADHDTRYYTKTELSTSGSGAQIHWNNLTSVPPLGDGTYDPVTARALEIGASTPPAGSEGDFYVDDSISPHYWKYISGVWVDQGAVSTGMRFIDLNDTDESIYQWDGSTWVDKGVPQNGWQVLVKDSGDGKQAIYVFDTATTSWKKIADVDWGSPTLDDVYNHSPSGAKTITVDDGSVDFSQTASYSPIVFNESSAKPVNSPASGKTGFTYIDGVLYMWDPDRSKWISVERKVIQFGANNANVRSRWLDYLATVPGLKAAELLPRDAVLCEIIFNADRITTGTFYVRTKADQVTNLASLAISGSTTGKNISLNVNFAANDIPLVYMDITGGTPARTDYPMVQLVFAHRLV